MQTISKAGRAEMQQIFMNEALHECELLNEAYKQNNSPITTKLAYIK